MAARAQKVEQQRATHVQKVEEQRAAHAQEVKQQRATRAQELEEQRAAHADEAEERRVAHALRVQAREAESHMAHTRSIEPHRAQTHSLLTPQAQRDYAHTAMSHKHAPRTSATRQAAKLASVHAPRSRGLPASKRDPLVAYIESLGGLVDTPDDLLRATRSSRSSRGDISSSSSRPARLVPVEELNAADRQAAADAEALRAFREAKQRKQDYYAKLRGQASLVKQQPTISKPGKAGVRATRAADGVKKKNKPILTAFTSMLSNLQDVLAEAVEPKTTVPSCADRKDSNSACV
jgi:hypothetical protein